MSNPAKGWSRNEAYMRASLRQTQEQIYRSAFATMYAFDPVWGEHVVVSYHPTAPITVNRKPRRGLRTPYRIISKEQYDAIPKEQT